MLKSFVIGGEGGIRTHKLNYRQTDFELYPFDRLWTISLEIVGM